MRRVGVLLVASAALLAAAALALAGVGDRAGALSDWQAFVLGIVQGLTELLPISSSGHLILVPWLGEWTFLEQNDEFNQTFDVALHLGTLVAVVLYFRRDIALLAGAFVRSLRTRRADEPSERVAWFVVLATVPAALGGALLVPSPRPDDVRSDPLEGLHGRDPGRAPAGLDRPLLRRHDRGRGQRHLRDLGPPRLRPPPHVLGLRDL